MKNLPINSTSDHPETQGQLRMTEGHFVGEILSVTQRHSLLTLVSSPKVERSVVRHPPSILRNFDDQADMEQVEYSERPYLTDEKWFV